MEPVTGPTGGAPGTGPHRERMVRREPGGRCPNVRMRRKETWHLFCYDTRRKLWHREDATHAIAFAAAAGELYCLEAGGRVLALLGTQGTVEGRVPFLAETGDLGLEDMEHKYLQRVELSLLLGEGTTLSVCVSYDSGATCARFV